MAEVLTIKFVPTIETTKTIGDISKLKKSFETLNFKNLGKGSKEVKTVTTALAKMDKEVKDIGKAFANQDLNATQYAELKLRLKDLIQMQKAFKTQVDVAMEAEKEAYAKNNPKLKEKIKDAAKLLKTMQDQVIAARKKRQEEISKKSTELESKAPDRIKAYEADIRAQNAIIKEKNGIDEKAVKIAKAKIVEDEKKILIRQRLTKEINAAKHADKALIETEEQAITKQQKLIATMNNMGIDQAQQDEINKRLKEMGVNLDKVGRDYKQTAQDADHFNSTLASTAKQAKAAQGPLGKFSNWIGKLGKMALITIGVRKLFREIKKGIQIVSDLDEKLTEIATVTGKTRKEMWQTFDAFNTMAKQLGSTTKEVIDASVIFYRQGKKTAEVMELVKASVISAAIANIDTASASNRLTSAINGFQLAGEQAMEVADKFAGLAAKSASSFDELSYALSKTAASAKVAGIDIDHMLGFIAKTVETTREAAENIGTAFKTIIARMQQLKELGKTLDDGMSLNKAEKALGTIGVALRDSVTGQFRDLDEVFNDLGKRWDELDRNTKSYLATILAGSRQQSRFLALMNNYERTTELVEVAQNSAGEASTQFATHLTGIEAAMNRLKATGEDFYQKLVNADVLKALIEALSQVIQMFTQLNPLLGIALGITTALIAKSVISLGLLVQETVVKGKLTFEQALLNNLKKNGLVLKIKEIVLDKLDITQKIMKSKVMKILTASHLSYNFVVAAGIILLIAIIAVIAAVITARERQIRKAKEATEQSKEELSVMERKEDKLRDLAAAYEDLTAKQAKSVEEQKELVKVTKELTDLFPHLVQGFKSNGEAIFDNASLHEELGIMIQQSIDKSKEYTANLSKEAFLSLKKEDVNSKANQNRRKRGSSAIGILLGPAGELAARSEQKAKLEESAAIDSVAYEAMLNDYKGQIALAIISLSDQIIDSYKNAGVEISGAETNFIKTVSKNIGGGIQSDIVATAAHKGTLNRRQIKKLSEGLANSYEMIARDLADYTTANEGFGELFQDSMSVDSTETVAEVRKEIEKVDDVLNNEIYPESTKKILNSLTKREKELARKAYGVTTNRQLRKRMEEEASRDIDNVQDQILQQVDALRSTLNDNLAEAGSDVQISEDFFNDFSMSVMNNLSKTLEELTDEGQLLFATAFGKLTEGNSSMAIEEFFSSDFQNINTIGDSTKALKKLADQAGLTNVEFLKLSSTLIGQTNMAIDGLIENADASTSRIETLAKAQAELISTGNLSISMMAELNEANIEFGVDATGSLNIMTTQAELSAENARDTLEYVNQQMTNLQITYDAAKGAIKETQAELDDLKDYELPPWLAAIMRMLEGIYGLIRKIVGLFGIELPDSLDALKDVMPEWMQKGIDFIKGFVVKDVDNSEAIEQMNSDIIQYRKQLEQLDDLREMRDNIIASLEDTDNALVGGKIAGEKFIQEIEKFKKALDFPTAMADDMEEYGHISAETFAELKASGSDAIDFLEQDSEGFWVFKTAEHQEKYLDTIKDGTIKALEAIRAANEIEIADLEQKLRVKTKLLEAYYAGVAGLEEEDLLRAEAQQAVSEQAVEQLTAENDALDEMMVNLRAKLDEITISVMDTGDAAEEAAEQFDKYYNALQRIENLKFNINLMSALIDSEMVNSEQRASAYLVEAKALGELSKATQAQALLVDADRQAELNRLIAKRPDLYYEENGMLMVNIDLLNAKEELHEGITKEVEAEVDAYNDLRSQVQALELDLIAIGKQMDDLSDKWRDDQIALEELVLEAVKEEEAAIHQEIIDKMKIRVQLVQDELDLVKSLWAQRQKEKDAANKRSALDKKIARYNLISMDNSGKYLKEKLQLEQEIADARYEIIEDQAEDDYNTIVDGLEDKKEGIETEIEMEQDAYETRLENLTGYWERVHEIIGRGQTGVIDYLKANSHEYKIASDLQQDAYLDGWNETWTAADAGRIAAELGLGSLTTAYEDLAQAISDLIAQINRIDLSKLGKTPAPVITPPPPAVTTPTPTPATPVYEDPGKDFDFDGPGTVPIYTDTGTGGTGVVTPVSPIIKPGDAVVRPPTDTGTGTPGLPGVVIDEGPQQPTYSGAWTGAIDDPILFGNLWDSHGYAKGGMNDSTGLAMMHGTAAEPEAVLNPLQTKAFLSLADHFDDIFRMVDIDLGGAGNNTPMINHITVEVDESVNEDTAELVGEKIAESMDTYFNNLSKRSPNKLSIVRGF